MGAVDEKAKNSCPGTGHGTGCGKTKRILELIDSPRVEVLSDK